MPLRIPLFVLCVASATTWSNLPRTGPSLSLHPEVQSSLQVLIAEAAALHETIGSKAGQSALAEKIHQLQTRIRLVYRQFNLMAYSPKKNHAIRLLGIIDDNLEGLKIQGKDIGKRNMKKLFGTIAELAQAYHIKTASSGIFYCPRDKSLWIQSGNKPQNPISPGLKNCGRRVW